MSPELAIVTDYGAGLAVDIVADAMAATIGAAPEVGRNRQPGADLSSSPAAGIEAAAPWATFARLGRCVTVAWRLRMILGRWETGASLALALDAYRAAAPPLRAAGFDVGPLEAPAVATIANQPYLVAAFPAYLTLKE